MSHRSDLEIQVMKVCYFIQTHKNPKQIYRLVRIIKQSSPTAIILINHNFQHCDLDITPLNDLSDVHLLKNDFTLIRANFSCQMQPYLNGIKWLLENNISFDWLINLTGQDYPIQPPSRIDNFLLNTDYDGFLEYFPAFSAQSTWGMKESHNRYSFKYKQLVNSLPTWQQEVLKPLKIINYIQPFFRINFSYGIKFGLRHSVPFNQNFICYGGAAFLTLSRKCVEYLDDFVKSHPHVVNYYQGVSIPEESLIQTVLVNSQLFNLCNDSKRYFDYSQTHHGHPRILTTDDYLSLLKSNKHFARKFDMEQDSNILDVLDGHLLDHEISSKNSVICQ